MQYRTGGSDAGWAETIAAWISCAAMAAVLVGFMALREQPSADATDASCDAKLGEEIDPVTHRSGTTSRDENESDEPDQDASTRRRSLSVISLPGSARRQVRE